MESVFANGAAQLSRAESSVSAEPAWEDPPTPTAGGLVGANSVAPTAPREADACTIEEEERSVNELICVGVISDRDPPGPGEVRPCAASDVVRRPSTGTDSISWEGLFLLGHDRTTPVVPQAPPSSVVHVPDGRS